MIVYYQSNLFYYVALIVSASGEASGPEEALPSPEKKWLHLGIQGILKALCSEYEEAARLLTSFKDAAV